MVFTQAPYIVKQDATGPFFSHSPKNRRKGLSLQKTNMAMFFWDWKTPENQHDIGTSPFSIGNTSSFMVVVPLSC